VSATACEKNAKKGLIKKEKNKKIPNKEGFLSTKHA